MSSPRGTPPEQPEALTVAEMARRLRIPYKKALRLLHTGKVRGVQIDRVWRVDAADVTRYLRGDRRDDDSQVSA